MRHARRDYDRFQDPAGIIPKDEPVFLLRGQDEIAAEAVDYYAAKVEAAGGDADVVRKSREWANEMRRWPIQKMPDLPKAGDDAFIQNSVDDGLRARGIDPR